MKPRSIAAVAGFASLTVLFAGLAAAPTSAGKTLQFATLGDLSRYEVIAADTLASAKKGDLTAAKRRGTDLETAWDQAEDTLRPTDRTRWRVVDKAIDRVLSELRAEHPKQAAIVGALDDLLATLGNGGAA